MKPCALYHRVSTLDQSKAAARRVLRQAAAQRRYRVVLDVEETGSGAQNDRPGLQRVLAAANRGEIAAVLVWKLDRFGRSALDLLTNIDRLQAAGVAFVCVSQSLELRGDAMSKLLLTMLAGVAEFERELIRERTRLGLARARGAGAQLGRPAGDQPDAARVRELRRRGASWTAVALELDCNVMAARRVAAKGGRNARAARVRKRS